MLSRRRLGIGLLGAAGAVLGLVVVGGGFTYAGQLLPAPRRDRTLDITATLHPDGTVVLPADRRACLETFGLLLADGFVTYGGPVEGTCDGVGTVRRQVTSVDVGDPPTGAPQPARFDEYAFVLGPAQVGLDPEEVRVETPRGPAPAWFIDGERDVWVVVVHGRSATRAESLRLLPTVAAAGYPSLVITYRNDFAGGPPAEDDTSRFGQAEWPDLTAAVEHARANGARAVVLAGFSQGGSLIGYHLRNHGSEGVAGVILDSPLLDLGDTLVQQARLRDIPGPLIPPILFGTRIVARLRSGFDIADVDHVATIVDSDVPTLLIHGAADDFVPVGPSDAVARERSQGLTYERVEGAGHVEAWNADPERYATVVDAFLRGL